jgi:hypothetical protein
MSTPSRSAAVRASTSSPMTLTIINVDYARYLERESMS